MNLVVFCGVSEIWQMMLWSESTCKTGLIHKRKEGHGGGQTPKWMQPYFLCISDPGLLDFPVAGQTLLHTALFLMVPDSSYGFGVLHIGGSRDDIESKNWVLVFCLQLWLIRGVYWLSIQSFQEPSLSSTVCTCGVMQSKLNRLHASPPGAHNKNQTIDGVNTVGQTDTQLYKQRSTTN